MQRGGAHGLGSQSHIGQANDASNHKKNYLSQSSALKNHSADKTRSIQPITEKILDEEHDESGIQSPKDDKIEEEVDEDIARSGEVIDLEKVKMNNDDTIQEEPKEAETAETPKSHKLNINDFDVSSKEGFKELLRFQMRIYD